VNLREHVVLGGGAALALTPVLGAQDSAVFWAASVLIDADHYWDYLYRSRFRDWSPRRMFEFHRTLFPQIRRPDFLALSLFHTVEWFALIYLVATFLESSAVAAVFWGMAFHLALDALWLTLHRALFSRAFSMIEYVLRRRRLRQRGLEPDLVYDEALTAIGVTPVARPSPSLPSPL